jgi:hypothetical protein
MDIVGAIDTVGSAVGTNDTVGLKDVDGSEVTVVGENETVGANETDGSKVGTIVSVGLNVIEGEGVVSLLSLNDDNVRVIRIYKRK